MAAPKFLTENTCPHIGGMINGRLKERKIYKAALARHIKRDPATINDYLHRPSLQVALLWMLSTALKHNFFLDLAAQLPPDFTTYAPDTTLALQERIATLEEENKLLAARLDECRGLGR